MTKFVIKKDGKKVPFDSEKLKASIMAACSDAGLSDEEKNSVAMQVSSSVIMDFNTKEEVSTTEIKDKVLSELDTSYSIVAKAWRKYEEGKSE